MYRGLFLLLVLIFSSPTLVKASLAANVIGNDFDNSLYGSTSDDTIRGNGGSDNLFGITGNDEISGGFGNDFIQGDSGDDVLKGEEGNDLVQGGSGKDLIDGGPGDDTLIASFIISSTTVRDFEPDNIVCGNGIDTAFINRSDNDTASEDCEIIVDTPAPLDGNESKATQSSNLTILNQSELLPLP